MKRRRVVSRASARIRGDQCGCRLYRSPANYYRSINARYPEFTEAVDGYLSKILARAANRAALHQFDTRITINNASPSGVPLDPGGVVRAIKKYEQRNGPRP